jgi:hypothetical protein
MRILCAVIFIFSVGTAPVSALPVAGSHLVSASSADHPVQLAKHTRPAHRRSRAADGGIHPLVGSGEY